MAATNENGAWIDLVKGPMTVFGMNRCRNSSAQEIESNCFIYHQNVYP